MGKNQILEYFVPIESKATINDEFIIEGIALNETTTSNGHTFLEDELRKSAKTLQNAPLLKDHNNSVDAIVGKVKESSFDEFNKRIPFKAIVKDKKMQDKIKSGLINSVSVGAHVDPKDIEETEDGIIPHNIIFKELSLVAIPADPGATFTKALNNAYQKFKESHSTKVDQNTERGKETMTDKLLNSKVEATENIELEKSESDAILDKLESAKTELAKTELALVERKLEKSKKELTEADVDEEEEKPEEPAEKVEEEPEPESTDEESAEEEEVVEEKGKYKITQGHDSFTYERDSYVY